MTDPTTPTDQPDELSAIRRFVGNKNDFITEDSLKEYGWTNSIREYEWDKNGIWHGAGFSTAVIEQLRAAARRLFELLDERDAENRRLYNNLQGFAEVSLIESALEDFLETMDWSADISDDTKTLVLGNLRGLTNYLRSEKENFDKSLDETVKFTENLIVKSLQSDIESLRRELAEARGLMQEWYDGLPTYDLAWLESLKTRVSNFLTNQ